MTATANKTIAEYSDESYKFSLLTWNPLSSINNYLREVNKWGELMWYPNLVTGAKAKVNEWTITTEIIGYKINDPESKKREEKVISSMKKLGEKIPHFTFAIFDDDFNIFAYKISTAGTWRYSLGTIDDKWEILSFDVLHKLIHSKKLFVWRLGDVIFKGNDTDFKHVLACVVLDTFCDRLIPANTEENYVQVTEDGFCLIYDWLHSSLSSVVNYGRASILSHFKELDRMGAIPLIPKMWKDYEIECLNTKKLKSISQKIIENNAVEDSDDDKEDDSTNSTDGNTGNQYIDNARDYVKNRLNDYNKGILEGNVEGISDTLKLSEILDEKSLFRHKLWGEEFFVDIDTNICEKGFSLMEDEILFALCSYGVLEILIEESVIINRNELERAIEERYGISCLLYLTTESKGADLLKQSGGKVQ